MLDQKMIKDMAEEENNNHEVTVFVIFDINCILPRNKFGWGWFEGNIYSITELPTRKLRVLLFLFFRVLRQALGMKSPDWPNAHCLLRFK